MLIYAYTTYSRKIGRWLGSVHMCKSVKIWGVPDPLAPLRTDIASDFPDPPLIANDVQDTFDSTPPSRRIFTDFYQARRAIILYCVG